MIDINNHNRGLQLLAAVNQCELNQHTLTDEVTDHRRWLDNHSARLHRQGTPGERTIEDTGPDWQGMPREKVMVDEVNIWQGTSVRWTMVNTALDRLGTTDERMPVDSTMANTRSTINKCLNCGLPSQMRLTSSRRSSSICNYCENYYIYYHLKLMKLYFYFTIMQLYLNCYKCIKSAFFCICCSFRYLLIPELLDLAIYSRIYECLMIARCYTIIVCYECYTEIL